MTATLRDTAWILTPLGKDTAFKECASCGVSFSLVIKRHHCVVCEKVVCGKCSEVRTEKNLLFAETRGRKCDACFWNGKNGNRQSIDENLPVSENVSSTSTTFEDTSTNPSTIGTPKIPKEVAAAAVNRTPLRELSNGSCLSTAQSRSPAQQSNQSTLSRATYPSMSSSAVTPFDDSTNNIPTECSPTSTRKKHPSPVKLVGSATKKKKDPKLAKKEVLQLGKEKRSTLFLFPSYILIGFTFLFVILLLCISKYKFAAKSALALHQRQEYNIADNRVILAAEGEKVEEERFIHTANLVTVRQSQQQLSSKLSVKNFVENLLNKINAILLLPSKILETILVSRTK